MIITLDLDGVLADLPKLFCEIISKKYGNEIKTSQLNNYQLGDLVLPEDQDWLHTLIRTAKFYEKILPTPGAESFVDRLGSIFDMYVVTARPEIVHKQTQKYVQKHFPKIKGVFRVDLPEQKLAIIQELMSDVHLEDYPELCTCLALHDIRTCVYDQPFNRALDDTFSHSNLKRIYSFEHFERYILQLPSEDRWTLTLKELKLNG